MSQKTTNPNAKAEAALFSATMGQANQVTDQIQKGNYKDAANVAVGGIASMLMTAFVTIATKKAIEAANSTKPKTPGGLTADEIGDITSLRDALNKEKTLGLLKWITGNSYNKDSSLSGRVEALIALAMGIKGSVPKLGVKDSKT